MDHLYLISFIYVMTNIQCRTSSTHVTLNLEHNDNLILN